MVTLSQSTAITNPSEFKFDSTGRLLFADTAPGASSPCPGGRRCRSTPSPARARRFLAIDATNRIYTSSSDGKIRLHASDGTLINDAFATLTGCCDALGPGGLFGGDLYALEVGSGILYRINAVGTVTAIGSGFTDVADIAFGPDGDLYVSERALDRVLKISPSPSAVGSRDRPRAGAAGVSEPLSTAVMVNYDGPAPARPRGVAIFNTERADSCAGSATGAAPTTPSPARPLVRGIGTAGTTRGAPCRRAFLPAPGRRELRRGPEAHSHAMRVRRRGAGGRPRPRVEQSPPRLYSPVFSPDFRGATVKARAARPLDLTGRISMAEDNVLVVVSKIKNYIRAKSEMNTAGTVPRSSSEIIQGLCDQAIENAKADGRRATN